MAIHSARWASSFGIASASASKSGSDASGSCEDLILPLATIAHAERDLEAIFRRAGHMLQGEHGCLFQLLYHVSQIDLDLRPQLEAAA